MATASDWPIMPPPGEGDEATVHFRPPRRRYTPQSVLLTLSRFAPMIDMSFLLLIFFMTTTRFAQPEGLLSSQMPRYGGAGGTGPAVALPVTPLYVRLSVSGPGRDDCAIRIDSFPNETPADFNQLAATLRGIHQKPGFDAETPIIIAAETDVRWDHVVNCWNAALRAECKNVAFAEP